MSLGQTPKHQDLFQSSTAFCAEQLPEQSIYALLHREGHRLFPDGEFADLFTRRGRTCVPPDCSSTFFRAAFLIGVPQIGPPQSCRLLGLGMTPALDLLVVTGDQDLRHRSAIPLRGPRVMRIFEQPVESRAVRFVHRGIRISEHAGQQARTRIDDGHRGHFTTGQHEIPQRDLFVDERMDPRVEPFVTSA